MSDSPKFKTFRDLKSVSPVPAKPKLEDVASIELMHSLTSNTSIATLPIIDGNRSTAGDNGNRESSVSKDFQKIPNSVTRQFLAQGVFKGKSKQVWDYLWSVSRGAINPSRFVRKPRPEIKTGTGIGSFVTVDKAIKHLEEVGLLKKIELSGSHDGNKFEIFTPDEISSSASIASNTSNTSYTQKVAMLALPESSNAREAQSPVNIERNVNSKTSFKTNTIDDESDVAFSRFISRFEEVSKKLTGKGISKRELEKWEALAELLILELEVAAKRSGNISSVPAFLTEVLRRQFFVARSQKTEKLTAKSTRIKPDVVGKSESQSEAYEIKQLDELGREAALEQLREFTEESFLEDFAKWYTPEDWQWLTENLKAGKK